jgi:hypothetical protein
MPKTTLLLCVLILCFVGGAAMAAVTPGLTLYVNPKGNDKWTGHSPILKAPTGPFATLEAARDAIRKLKQAGTLPPSITVELAGGVYELAQTFRLEAQDSGTEACPITYRSQPKAEVRLVGGREITTFKPVTDKAVLDQLQPWAQGKVLQADLKAMGVTDFGDVVASGKRLELFFMDQPMTIARWPNEGYARIQDVIGGAPHKIHGIPGDKIGKFTYEGDQPSRWTHEKDLWLEGYWFWDWADERQRVESIDTAAHSITLKPPYHTYGYRRNQWWYAFNALSELDSPGEWYLDREVGMLYFWPTAPLSKGKTLISIVPTLIDTKDVSYLTLRGFICESCRSTAITMSGGTGNRVAACVIRNTGAGAVSISGGTNNGVIGCDIYNTADGGISLQGGDRKTLTPAGLYADNNHVHHFARWNRVYRPGISLQGVGNRATHNLIDNCPHMAMGFGGNDHLIEYNEIHSAVYESNDAGAIYTGRNWSMWGTVIRYNYFHHINGWEGRGCVGVYLDDQFSGTMIYGNMFYKVTRASMVGGGRYCTMENNVFVDCVPATHVDARGLGWAGTGESGMVATLKEMPYTSDLWRQRYPNMTNTLEDNPMAPVGNVIARNICVGGRWIDLDGRAKPFVTFIDNLLDQDPLFVDAAHGNFNLRPESPAFKLGFKPLPLDKMGLYRDDLRASWPVKSEIRPLSTPPVAAAAAGAKPAGPPPVFQVLRTTAPITVDGDLKPVEWAGADPLKAMLIEQGVDRVKQTPRSLAWLSWDDQALYVAFDNPVNPKFPIRMGNAWGQDDAVEIAIRNPEAGAKAVILVLRGFPSGHFESSDEAGASAAATKLAARDVKYAARVVDSKRWTAEFRIPFASLGIDPSKPVRYPFNLSVRKTADDQWLEWVGTGTQTWALDTAGFIQLIR